MGYKAGGSGPGPGCTGCSRYEGASPRGCGADTQLWLHLQARAFSSTLPKEALFIITQRLLWASGVSVEGLADLAKGVFVFRAAVLKVHKNHLEGLLKQRLLGSKLRISDSVGLEGGM